MAIANGFLAKSATVAGVSLSGMTSFGISESGSPVELRSDGQLYSTVTPIIPGNVEVEVETRDISAAISPGTTGSLSLVSDKMVGGKTLTGTTSFTAAGCTVLSASRGTDISGSAVLRISARINSADGVASGLTITGA